MTTPQPLTYTALMSEALLELSRASLSGAVRFDRPDDAVIAAQARTRIYRVAARSTQLSRTGLGTANTGPSARLTDREAAAARRLQNDLALSVDRTSAILEVPTAPGDDNSIAGLFQRAATAAERAWNLLATELTSEGNLRPYALDWVRQLGERAVLTDAILLAWCMANLDLVLEPAIWAVAVDLESPAQLETPLQQVAADCQTLSQRGIASYCTEILDRPAASAAARAALNPTEPAPLANPIEAVAAFDAYLDWLQRHGAELSMPDLANIAATAARLVALTIADDEHGVSGRVEMVRNWRRVHHAIRPLRTVHPRPVGHQQADALIEWADRQLGAGIRPDSAMPGWQAARRWIASQLPALADAGEASLRRLHTRRLLHVPDATRGHHLHGPADDGTVSEAIQAFAAARQVASTCPRSASDLRRQALPGPPDVTTAGPSPRREPRCSPQPGAGRRHRR